MFFIARHKAIIVAHALRASLPTLNSEEPLFFNFKLDSFDIPRFFQTKSYTEEFFLGD